MNRNVAKEMRSEMALKVERSSYMESVEVGGYQEDQLSWAPIAEMGGSWWHLSLWKGRVRLLIG